MSDFGRSLSFYEDLFRIKELQRFDRVAVLGSSDLTGSPLIFLRQAGRVGSSKVIRSPTSTSDALPHHPGDLEYPAGLNVPGPNLFIGLRLCL